jgi:hypothetical protein
VCRSISSMVGGAVRGEIGGHTVGVVGLGHIGREVAWRAAALGCRVLAVNRTMREKPALLEHVFSWTELDRMLGECDIVVLPDPRDMGLIRSARSMTERQSVALARRRGVRGRTMRPEPYRRCPPTARVVSSQCGRAAWS